MLECVVNVSEGRRADVVRALAAACGPALLDIHTDPDHNRSVFTLAGRGDEAGDAALRLARTVGQHIDISGHRGVHPRLGAMDVVPFVALPGDEPGTAVAVARRWGSLVAETLGVPVFLYHEADPAGRSLPETRRDAFSRRAPDFGPPVPHPRLGAMAVGARPLLVAVNCELEGSDPELAGERARRIAGQMRERDGGMPGVRALGFWLASKGRAQVSMNLVDLGATGLEAACSEVRRLARAEGADVAAVELVGLVAAAELARCSPDFLRWSGLGPDHAIEARLRAAGLLDAGPDGP